MQLPDKSNSIQRFMPSPQWACALILAAHALLLGWSAAWNSATFDESVHLAAGVEYWKQGHFSIYSLSPPLLHLWGAALPAFAGAQAPPPGDVLNQTVVEQHWDYNDPFVYANFPRFPFLLILARFSLIPLSILAGWIVYRWASAIYGPFAGVAACALYCFNPVILANASLFTTDLGTAAFMLLAVWLWRQFCVAPSAGRFTAVCGALLVSCLCKYTAILLWPMMFVMAAPLAAANHNLRRLTLSLIGSAVVVLVGINVLYGFHATFAPIGSLPFQSDFMQHLSQHLPYHFPAMFPRLYIMGFDAQKLDTQAGYDAFLFGDLYQGSHWYYYPLALLCKMPISVMVLTALALGSLAVSLRSAAQISAAEQLAVLGAGLVFVAGILILSDLNIGIRYLLPGLPLAAILIARLWAAGAPTRAGMRYLRNGLLVLATIESLVVTPRFLSYVNIAAGGSDKGWQLLSNSDFDWGQSLRDLHRWMNDNHVPSVTLAYFGLVDPRVYGVNFTPITDRSADEPYVAVSSYYLDGQRNRMVIGLDKRAYIQIPYYRALQTKTPVAILGHTIFIYRRQDVQAASLEGGMGQ